MVKRVVATAGDSLNESPSEKEGKSGNFCGFAGLFKASMKAPPKRKGNMADGVFGILGELPQ